MLDSAPMESRAARMAFSCLAMSALFLVASPGCVVRLSDRNEPLPNGGVTGAAAKCSSVDPLGKGGPGSGAAEVKYVGRYDVTDPSSALFDWSGNYVTARFEGTEVSASFEFDHDADLVFNVVIDDGDPQKLTVTSKKKTYSLAKNLRAGTHEVLLMRSTEALFGTVTFKGFSFGDGHLLPPTERPRRIELIGDSITCGYGDEGPNAICPYDVEVRKDVRVPLSQNIYVAYGSIAGRELSADVVTTCYSGKGIVFNYREPADDPDAKTTVPQYWERTLASKPDAPPWDFTKDLQPQVVVVALGTNDYTRDLNQDSVADGLDLAAFKKGTKDFLKLVRQRRPDAHIFVAVSPMLSDTFPFTGARSSMRDTFGQIVSEFASEGDKKMYRIEFVEMGTRYGLGCDYHPNLEVHRIMADQLVGAIRSKTCW